MTGFRDRAGHKKSALDPIATALRTVHRKQTAQTVSREHGLLGTTPQRLFQCCQPFSALGAFPVTLTYAPNGRVRCFP